MTRVRRLVPLHRIKCISDGCATYALPDHAVCRWHLSLDLLMMAAGGVAFAALCLWAAFGAGLVQVVRGLGR